MNREYPRSEFDSQNSPGHPEAKSTPEVKFRKLVNGSLKPNDLLSDEEGAQKAAEALRLLGVPYKVRLYQEEEVASEGATFPAGYAIELRNPSMPSESASEEDVKRIFEKLKESGIPVERVLPTTELKGPNALPHGKDSQDVSST